MIDTTVSTLLGFAILTGTLAGPAFSARVTSPTVKAGVSLSVMVTVPLSVAFEVFPLTTIPFTVKSSVGYPTKSSVIGMDTFTVVCPAGIVAVTVVVV